MVQRKRVIEKPRDAGGVSGGGGLAEDRARGGGASGGDAARPSSAIPGYMRPTSSSGAKAGRVVVGVGGEVADSVAPPVRGKMLFARAPGAIRATCSSSMKDPAAAAGRVCRYSYCSLKGHVRADVVPLRSFLASERRLIKTQQSMKHKGVSPLRRTSNGGVGGDGCFVEILTGPTATASTASSDVGCCDLSSEELDAMSGLRMENATFDHQNRRDAGGEVNDPEVSVDGSCGSSGVISDGLAEFTRGPGEEMVEDEEASADQDFGECRSDILQLDANDEDRGGENSVESSVDDISSAFGGMNLEDVGSDSTDAATRQRTRLIAPRRAPPTEADRVRAFNPRSPDFLPLEPNPDPEKVDLRYQLADDRRSAEEWMVDYALRRTVNKLARAQKRKVEMLVLAFETVLPPVPGDEEPAQQDDGSKNDLARTRPSQAAS